MGISTKVTGWMIKPMATAYSLTLMGQDTKESGKTIYNMAMELKFGKMGLLNILENFTKERKTVKADLNGMMGLFMKAILWTECSKASASTTLPISIKLTKENSG